MNTNADPTRIAKNEDLRRDQNNRLEADNASVHWVNPPYADWICECANPKCSEPVQLSVSEYDEVRTNPTHFIIVPSEKHISADVERVVQRTDRYWIVEKLGIAAAVSKDEDSEPPA
jgi:hypothetical protein